MSTKNICFNKETQKKKGFSSTFENPKCTVRYLGRIRYFGDTIHHLMPIVLN